ncbi:hypothetical protein LTR10_011511 [Elasticomyces elasticus]|uniref:RmlC-like cupin domain-containing protein n=1 Tax=Exophiala sideris TaxID=1016849 RepID=A0ABR0JD21_9EURO|nr:hypothetical protein LTR10_011511 [Elasticomyces elasticus]KAK5032031.1 hypothetical protein LTS07_004653 [Exophiala sideris]KAK5040960.1 hypothetical protein LTR13_003262 [Exophiala sideris]KAK5061706.1 hypothetical protein LTR69_004888 [Exophiala sideris]KAK5184406.1 hypothetical protein LTR44_003079 [Eurotiomycetes sp. CCFEE 6388]
MVACNFLLNFFLAFHFLGALAQNIAVPHTSSNTTLHLSAVVNSPTHPYHAIVECWALDAPFIRYPTVGRALDLGDTSNATYVVLPPRSAEGWHRPPHPMFFILLSGLAHVRTYKPTNDNMDFTYQQETPMDSSEPTETLYIAPGVNSLIIAVDTDKRSLGHLTYYPGDVETVALQIPFQDGDVPKHTVIHGGPCQADNVYRADGAD